MVGGCAVAGVHRHPVVAPPARGGRRDDDRVVEQFGDRHLGAVREPVVPRQAGHPVLGVEDQHPVFGQIHRRPDDGHLGGAVGEPGRRIGEVEFPWLDRDFGVGGLEVRTSRNSTSAPVPIR